MKDSEDVSGGPFAKRTPSLHKQYYIRIISNRDVEHDVPCDIQN